MTAIEKLRDAVARYYDRPFAPYTISVDHSEILVVKDANEGTLTDLAYRGRCHVPGIPEEKGLWGHLSLLTLCQALDEITELEAHLAAVQENAA